MNHPQQEVIEIPARRGPARVDRVRWGAGLAVHYHYQGMAARHTVTPVPACRFVVLASSVDNNMPVKYSPVANYDSVT